MSKIIVDKSNGIDVLGLEECKTILKYSLMADQPINLIGPPGVGKSAIVADVARDMKMSFEPLILSLCDPTDIGGFPVASAGMIERLPLGPIKRACNEPVILFLDELTCASPAVQGAAMRLVYERWAGDVKLHPGTRIIAASNPPDQAAGGWELALPLLGRMTQIRMRPKLKEVQEYFFKLGSDGSRIKELAVDFAATLQMAPELVQIDPPASASSTGTPWGSPRSWERAIKVCAQALDDGINESSMVFAAALAGNVGEDQAASFMTIRKVRSSLPSIDEILKSPEDAKLPTNVNTQVAILGVLAHVSQQDPCPAWVYAGRLNGEVRIAAMHLMGRFALKGHTKSPFFKKATQSQISMLKSMGKVLHDT